jgi:hypothetical protein
VQLDPGDRRSHRGRDRPGSAAQVDDHRSGPGAGDRLLGERFRAPAGHEDAGSHPDAQPAELRPPEHLLQRLPGHPAGDQPGERTGLVGRRQQQGRLVLGEDASRGAESGDDGWNIEVGLGWATPGWHGAATLLRRPRVVP